MPTLAELNKLSSKELEPWLPQGWLEDYELAAEDPPRKKARTESDETEEAQPASHAQRSVRLASELSKDQKTEIYRLWDKNVKKMYDKSSMKSTPDGKKKELFHVESRFLMLELPEARVKKPKGGTKAIRELVGYAMFRFDQEENNDGVKEDVLYMYELQVGEKYRSQGIGQMLLEGLDSLQKQSGLDKMMLSVLKNNRAVNFYKRHGFVLDEISPTEDDSDYDYFIMHRK